MFDDMPEAEAYRLSALEDQNVPEEMGAPHEYIGDERVYLDDDDEDERENEDDLEDYAV